MATFRNNGMIGIRYPICRKDLKTLETCSHSGIKDNYTFYLNGKFYGQGSLEYMKELFVDYVMTCEMYGKVE